MEETQRERHARLDQEVKDHLKDSERRFTAMEERFDTVERRFDTNDDAHDVLGNRIAAIEKKQDLTIAKLERYDWIARTTMTVVFLVGALIGLISHPSGASLRAFLGLFK